MEGVVEEVLGALHQRALDRRALQPSVSMPGMGISRPFRVAVTLTSILLVSWLAVKFDWTCTGFDLWMTQPSREQPSTKTVAISP